MPELSQDAERVRAPLPFGVAEVTGPSMVPTLYHGDRLLVHYGARVKRGDVVVLRHPFQQDLLVVKRAAERREGGWWVLGDNAYAGGDSTDYGVVPDELVLGRVRFRYRPRRPAQRSLPALVVWALSAARPVLSGRAARSVRSASRRLRAR
ncbi:nickel-type superoxide dismutase maturation protease [Streptomyces griseomycini]|uniref:Nickel-type superoxide dismutase maturation protease n=1 Tax=Streptomyces griseomycini TaxID=66895 RepID=A0A7W7LWJ3_9ACTN|nr:nickel-type superoxide dismutase maturation protease [Streptomyces griseomycini]MBB4897016.1 nickel-type superoxide dismutase maturation protease [Streptomyces griseomycini]GGP94434.1 S26 family signal peptidase [Streptomyces griseomycini]GGR30499.1 S26 family signal peptidase [Streptomyces griseomycini]